MRFINRSIIVSLIAVAVGLTVTPLLVAQNAKPYIDDGKTVVTSPHKVFGPESNDLVLQLRKTDVRQVILAGMSANLCTESHMRELLEQGFEVVVVTDATAAAKLPGFDGYEAAFVNYRMMASDVWSTAETVKTISSLK